MRGRPSYARHPRRARLRRARTRRVPRSTRAVPARGGRAIVRPRVPQAGARRARRRTRAALPRAERRGCIARLRRVTEKRYLFTPGPTPVPPEVLAATAEPMLHHRGPDFRIVYERTLGRLKEVFRTENDVLLFAASGTGTMESALVNLCSPGDRVCVVTAGAFGERWAAIAGALGCEVDRLAYDWGDSPSAHDLASRLAQRAARVVLMTQSE